MKIGGKNLTFDFKPLGYVDTSLGKLAVFGISHGEQTKVLGETSLSVKPVPPSELVKRLLPYVVHSVDVLGDDQNKPEAPTLTKEQVAAITPDEIEAILDIFIASQDHLYRKLENKPYKDDKGKLVLSLDYGEFEHPRKDGESNVDYLHRLYVLEEEELKRQMAKMTSLTSAHFSTGLTDSIKKTLQMGNSMSKFLEALRPPAMPDYSTLIPKQLELTPSLPSVDYAALAKCAEEARWAPFNAVNKRLDALVELTATSSEFMVQMNQTQTAIASEIKASGEEASKIGRDALSVTRWGFYATIAVFVLTVAGLVLSELDRRNGSSDSEFFRQRAEQFTTGLTDLSKAMAADRDAVSADLKAALIQIEQNRATQDKQVSTILNGQSELIRQQADRRLQDQQTIEDLRRKLSELEAKFEGREPQTQPVEGGE